MLSILSTDEEIRREANRLASLLTGPKYPDEIQVFLYRDRLANPFGPPARATVLLSAPGCPVVRNYEVRKDLERLLARTAQK